jgi:hypothetical protein
MGAVRSIRPAAPPCPQLHPSGGAGLDVHVRMRLGVLFASGAFGVIEVDAGGRLRTGAASPQVRGARVSVCCVLYWWLGVTVHRLIATDVELVAAD